MKNKEPENIDDESERIKQENEIKRIKLRLEYGADFPLEFTSENMTPELEGQFLDNVINFEKAFHGSEKILVYDFIGKPEYKKSEEISDPEISSALEQMMQLLNEQQIQLDTLCDVDDRELYRFITEELFLTETDNIKMEGWINHFTYEEFHPNHEFDLRNGCNEFIESFLDKESDFYANNLTQEAESNKWFDNFRQAFRTFTLDKLDITNIQFDELNAKVQFDLRFSGVIEGSNEIQLFSGPGEINFLKQWDFWYISDITLPASQN